MKGLDGHMPVIPFRHVPGVFGLTTDEWCATFTMVEECKQLIELKNPSDGYNI
jgi:diadenosine tetraphosphate (Ap4A) HIT family hydrolase